MLDTYACTAGRGCQLMHVRHEHAPGAESSIIRGVLHQLRSRLLGLRQVGSLLLVVERQADCGAFRRAGGHSPAIRKILVVPW